MVPDASILRLRISNAVQEGGGTVLVATLDDVLHTLRLEDVWMWRGEGLMTSKTFTQRREKLQEFVEHHWVPDARLLGGIYVSVAQPISMEQFAAKKDWTGVQSVEFIPDMPARRRMIWYLEKGMKAAEAHAGLKQDRVQPQQPQQPQQQQQQPRRARATPVDKMPDVYDLFHEDGTPLGRASVQQFKLSQLLRGSKEVWVTAEWRPEFQGYEITGQA